MQILVLQLQFFYKVNNLNKINKIHFNNFFYNKITGIFIIFFLNMILLLKENSEFFIQS